MTRRTIKKLLKRAEEALLNDRPELAAAIYGDMLKAFDLQTPSLLDHSAALYGRVRALHAMGLSDDAVALANSAVGILSVHAQRELAVA